MPTSLPSPIVSSPVYQSSRFTIIAQKQKKRVRIDFTVHSPIVNTRHLPHTLAVLRRHLPSVLTTQCFNESHRSFKQEVVQTEIGHLFEHILLRYLCDLKLASGAARAEYNGRTNWNWVRNPKGTFHIVIDAKEHDWHIFLLALERSIRLLERIALPMEENLVSTKQTERSSVEVKI